MKINANYIRHLFTANHQSEVTFLVKNYRHTQWLNELAHDKEYSLEIKVVKSKRSLQANKFLWSLLHQLEIVSKEPAMDWYIKSLVDTGAVVDYVWGTDATETMLKKTFRAVVKVKPHKIKDSDGWLYRVIVGSSKFTVAEMTDLLETVLRYCAELGIDSEQYKYE